MLTSAANTTCSPHECRLKFGSTFREQDRPARPDDAIQALDAERFRASRLLRELQILHLQYPSSPTPGDRRAISSSSPEPFGPPRCRKNRHGGLRSSARRRAELFRSNDRPQLGEFRERRQKVAREGKRHLLASGSSATIRGLHPIFRQSVRIKNENAPTFAPRSTISSTSGSARARSSIG